MPLMPAPPMPMMWTRLNGSFWDVVAMCSGSPSYVGFGGLGAAEAGTRGAPACDPTARHARTDDPLLYPNTSGRGRPSQSFNPRHGWRAQAGTGGRRRVQAGAGGCRRVQAGAGGHPPARGPARRRPRICRVERFRTASFSRPAVLRGPLSETATFAGLHLPSGAFSDTRAFANWGFVRPPVQNRYVRGSDTGDLRPNCLRCDRKVRRTARPPPSKNRSRQASQPRGQTLEEWELPPPPRHAPARTLRPSHRSHARQTREPPCPRSPQAQQVRSGPSLARPRRRPRGRQATPTQPTGTWTWQSDVASASSPPPPASPAS